MKKFKIGRSIYSISLLSSLGGVMLALTLTLLASIFINGEYLNTSSMCYVMYGIHGICAFCMTFVVWKIGIEKKLAAVLITITVYYILFFIIAIVIYNAVGKGISGGLISGLCGAAPALILCNYNKKKAKTRKRRSAFR